MAAQLGGDLALERSWMPSSHVLINSARRPCPHSDKESLI